MDMRHILISAVDRFLFQTFPHWPTFWTISGRRSHYRCIDFGSIHLSHATLILHAKIYIFLFPVILLITWNIRGVNDSQIITVIHAPMGKFFLLTTIEVKDLKIIFWSKQEVVTDDDFFGHFIHTQIKPFVLQWAHFNCNTRNRTNISMLSSINTIHEAPWTELAPILWCKAMKL